MPSLHLACDERAYSARKMSESLFRCGLRTEAAGGHTIIVRIHGRSNLYDFVKLRTMTNFKKSQARSP